MHTPNLEALFLTEEELELAKKEIKKMAFCKWHDAGRPEGSSRDFWSEAQLEWIEYRYVPDRYAPQDELCGTKNDYGIGGKSGD